MPGHIVTLAQQKGGAGKTTLAVHLAVTWASLGRSVACVDIDPQGSLSTWAAMRGPTVKDAPAAAPMQPIAQVAVSGWRVESEAQRLAKVYDIVVVDSPPHMETEAKMAIRAAHLVVIPVQPTPMDLWAVKPTIRMVVEERRDGLIVLNRAPSRGKLLDQVAAALQELAEPPRIAFATTRIGNRSAFASSMMAGKGVVELKRPGLAGKEIGALAAEVDRALA